jgi:hypothetical protein
VTELVARMHSIATTAAAEGTGSSSGTAAIASHSMRETVPNDRKGCLSSPVRSMIAEEPNWPSWAR